MSEIKQLHCWDCKSYFNYVSNNKTQKSMKCPYCRTFQTFKFKKGGRDE